jgi:hypothetical protein
MRRNGGMLTGEDGHLMSDLQSFGLLSVPFLLNGKLGGHNVGVFRYRWGSENWLWAVVSNWYGGLVRYGFHSLPAVVEDVLVGEYGSHNPKAESLGWAVADLDLRLREYNWKHRI